MTEMTSRATKGSELTHGELDANFVRDVDVKTTTYACLVTDNRSVIEGNHASTPFTVTLGDAATMAAADTGDYEVTIANIGAAAVTVARAGADTIDGVATSIVLAQYSSVTLKVNAATNGYNSVANVSSATLAELDIMDGATLTTAELNSLDADQAVTTPTVAGDDSFVMDDADVGTVKVDIDSVDTYLAQTTKTLTNKTHTSPVLNVGVSGTAVLDEDAMGSDSDTQLATQQSIKAYVDSRFALESEVATTSGTAVAISTTIPSWAKKININLEGVSTSGIVTVILQLGDSGGYEATGYDSVVGKIDSGGTSSSAALTTGFGIVAVPSASSVAAGLVTLSLMDSATNTWCYNGIVNGLSANINFSSGSKSLSATLDRIQITTLTGSDTFDAGAVSVSYEG